MDKIKFMSIEFNVGDHLDQWTHHFGWVQAVLLGLTSTCYVNV
jgi:hypothetical protein